MTPVDLLAEMEQDITWRSQELNSLLSTLTAGQSPIESSQRRAIVPLLQAHAEGFLRFCLRAYLRFISGQGVLGCDVISVHASWFLSKKFQSVRDLSIDDAFKSLGLPEDNRLIKRHYVEAQFIEALGSYLSQILILDESPLDRFDQNLDKPYLMGLLYQCGLDPLPHESYATKLNGLVIRRNQIAHGEDSVASLDEIKNWDRCLNELFIRVRDAIYQSAVSRSYLKTPELETQPVGSEI